MKRVIPMLKNCGLALAIASVTAVPAVAGDVNFSGFLSVGGGMLDDASSQSYNGFEEDNFTFSKNLLGLQVSGSVSEKVSVTAQMIARSDDDYALASEWAYLTYQVGENSKIRMGRLRSPFYMYSDFLDVGYAYAWISAPSEVYYLPFNNVDGIDFYSTSTLGSFDTSVQVYVGSYNSDFDLDGVAVNGQTRNQIGITGTIGRDWWTLRAAVHQTELTLAFSDFNLTPDVTFNGFLAGLSQSPFASTVSKVLVDGDTAKFAELGLNIDTGRFVAAAEYVEFEVADSFLSKNVRGYLMAGVRFGDFLVHVTGSQTQDEIAHPEAGIPLSDQTAPIIGALQAIAASRANERNVLTLGTRWDFEPGTALKLQLDDIKDELAGDQKVVSVAVQAVF